MIFLAIRFLKARPRQTLLMLLGFFFGTAAFISLSGLMLGFRYYLIYQLINNDAHVHIEPREEFLTEHGLDRSFYGTGLSHVFWGEPPSGRKDSAMIDSPGAWSRRLKADPRVVAYTPQLTASVIFSRGKATAPATLTGCDADQQIRVTTLGDYVKEGKFADISGGGNRLALGSELVKRLGVRLSQTVMVSLAEGTATPFKVVAIFETGNHIFDSNAYAALPDVQRVNRTPNQVNHIAVRLVDFSQAASIASTWASISQEKVESWDQRNASIFSVFKIQDAVRYLSIGAIMIVAGFGIYNVLNMTVMQKRRDVAILRSIGYSGGDIVTLFLSQGLILGCTGIVMGLTFGYAFSFYLETIPIGASPMGAGSGHLMISRDPMIYVHAAVLALSSALLASILPARAAGKLTPIEIIRSGAE